MNAELTAEKRPACVSPGLVFSGESGNMTTHKDEGRVEILVILLRVVSVEFVGLLTIDGEEVCAGIIGPQWIKELLEGRMEAGLRSEQWQSDDHSNGVDGEYHSGSS